MKIRVMTAAALLALAGCLLLCGCGSKDADNQTVSPVSEAGSLNGSASDTLRASMTVDNVTPGGLTVHFNLHEKRNEVLFGDSFRLEQRVGEDWAEVPVIREDYGFNLVGYLLTEGTERTMDVDWEWLYGRLSPGAYRIVKELVDTERRTPGGQPLKYELSAEFTIAMSE